MHLSHFFQVSGIPSSDVITGTYNLYLVALSYVMACLASYIALDITERIRTDTGSKIGWLISGALAMGCGIWTMHFIGMQALIMPMPMGYSTWITALSLVIAVVISGFALFLIKNEQTSRNAIITGGILLGLGICAMHYTGMAAMQDVHILYNPWLFALSVVIAIVASETALYLMIIGTNKTIHYKQQLKLISSLVMGFAISGMHYTGMAAAVFIPQLSAGTEASTGTFDILTPDVLSFYIAMITLIIMGIALAVSKYWVQTLRIKNSELLEAKAILNKLVDESTAREKRISDILVAAADGIVVTDEQGIIKICNRAASDIFGDGNQNFIGKQVCEFIGSNDSENQQVLKIAFDWLVRQGGQLLDLVALHPSRTIPIELAISTSSASHDKAAYVLVFRDIDMRKKSEEKLAQLNEQLVANARMVGMAEVATSVLHSVGNVLNSVNVSAQLLLERNNESQLLGLGKVVDLLEANKGSLDNFCQHHLVGINLFKYLRELVDFLLTDSRIVQNEIKTLNEKIHHIKNIVTVQQSLSSRTMLIENVKLDKLVGDALVINSELLQREGIIVQREYDNLGAIETDKVKVIQILVNLIKNAVEAMTHSTVKEKKLKIKIRNCPSNVQVEITDNGEGIRDITKIFTYGFTTKKSGHGFGLHSSARIAQSLGGSLQASSQGPGKGSTFTLTLPLSIKMVEQTREARTPTI